MSENGPDQQKTTGVPDKRKQILTAALHLFTTRGFHATPTSRISKEAGVSTGTLFHYFPDKNTLIDQLYLTVKREMGDFVRSEDSPSDPVNIRLQKCFIRYIRWGISSPDKARFIEQFHHSPNISRDIRIIACEELDWMKEGYQQAIREGYLSDHPVEYHMVMTMQVLTGIIELIESGDLGMTEEEIIRAGLQKIFQ
jgi:AcrR family transcriptional regulator